MTDIQQLLFNLGPGSSPYGYAYAPPEYSAFVGVKRSVDIAEEEAVKKRIRLTTPSFSEILDSPPSAESGIEADMTSPLLHESSGRGCGVIIIEEPEENYRARYESEGTRGPLKGRNDNHPTVKVIGCSQYMKVSVQLVYEDGTEHGACSLDDSGSRKNALVKEVGPHNNMTASFDDLRIRRERKDTKQKVTGSRRRNPVSNGRSDKIACLLFSATFKNEKETRELKIKSQPITLDTHQEPAELEWVKPNTSGYRGGEEIVIKGTKMTSPKVFFSVYTGSKKGYVSLTATLDKEGSHQNVLVVKVPPLPKYIVGMSEKKVDAQVFVTTGKNQLRSNPIPFSYLPDHICPRCCQLKKGQDYAMKGSPNVSLSSSSPNLVPESKPLANIQYTAQSNPYSFQAFTSGISPSASMPINTTNTVFSFNAPAPATTIANTNTLSNSPGFGDSIASSQGPLTPASSVIDIMTREESAVSLDALLDETDISSPESVAAAQIGLEPYSLESFAEPNKEEFSKYLPVLSSCSEPTFTSISSPQTDTWCEIRRYINNHAQLQSDQKKVLYELCEARDSRLFDSYMECLTCNELHQFPFQVLAQMSYSNPL